MRRSFVYVFGLLMFALAGEASAQTLSLECLNGRCVIENDGSLSFKASRSASTTNTPTWTATAGVSLDGLNIGGECESVPEPGGSQNFCAKVLFPKEITSDFSVTVELAGQTASVDVHYNRRPRGTLSCSRTPCDATDEGETITITANISDPDGSIDSWDWHLNCAARADPDGTLIDTPGSMVVASSNRSVTVSTPTPPWEVCGVSLIAHDDDGARAYCRDSPAEPNFCEVNIDYDDGFVNSPVTASLGCYSPVTGDVSESVCRVPFGVESVVYGNAQDDDSNHGAEFDWAVTGLEGPVRYSANGETIYWTAPQEQGTATVRLTVSDAEWNGPGEGTSDTRTIRLYSCGENEHATGCMSPAPGPTGGPTGPAGGGPRPSCRRCPAPAASG